MVPSVIRLFVQISSNANGIEAHVGGHYLQGGVGEILATDYATIYVADDDVLVAMDIIEEYENSSSDLDENYREDTEETSEEELDSGARNNSLMPVLIYIVSAAFFIMVLYQIVKYLA